MADAFAHDDEDLVKMRTLEKELAALRDMGEAQREAKQLEEEAEDHKRSLSERARQEVTEILGNPISRGLPLYRRLEREPADSYVLADEQLMGQAVKTDGFVLRLCKGGLAKNKGLVLKAVQQQGLAIGDSWLHDDRDVALAAVTQNGMALAQCADALKSDRDVVLAAVRCHGDALKFACKELADDNEVVGAAVSQRGAALRYASNRLRGNGDVAIIATAQNKWASQFIGDKLRADRAFMLELIEVSPWAVNDASCELQADREFLQEALRVSGGEAHLF